MNQYEAIIANLILAELNKYIENIPDGETKDICKAYSEQVVPELVDALCSGDPDFTFLAGAARQEVLNKLNSLKPKINDYVAQTLFTVLHKAAEKIPNENAKLLIENEVYSIASSGIRTFIDEENWDAALAAAEGEIKNYAAGYTIEISRKAIEKGRQYLPENEYTALICDNAGNLAEEIIKKAAAGEDIEAVCNAAAKKAADKLMARGVDITNNYIRDSIKAGAKRIHVHGKGSRKINRRIDSAAGELSDSLTQRVTGNIYDVASGEKDIAEAAQDIVVGTAKDTAANYIEKHGAELAAEAVERITKNVAAKMKDDAAKKIVLSTGMKLANANTLMAVTGGIIDIGKSFKDYLDGNITKAQLLRNIGEQGSNACLATVYGGIGMAVGGPVGAAVGSMVGYMASSMLYGAVLTQFENEEAARQRAEQTHEFCETLIKQMRVQRIAFEKNAAALLRERAQIVTASFDVIDKAILSSDFNQLSEGLGNIARAFGKELQFKTFEEFDEFMKSDESFEL